MTQQHSIRDPGAGTKAGRGLLAGCDIAAIARRALSTPAQVSLSDVRVLGAAVVVALAETAAPEPTEALDQEGRARVEGTTAMADSMSREDRPVSQEGCRVLVVEDEYFLADEIRRELTEAGADVVGPVGTVGEAITLIRAGHEIDAAVLDINLRGETSFGIADALAQRGIPFVFATGYDQSVIPARHAAVRRCEKPTAPGSIERALFG